MRLTSTQLNSILFVAIVCNTIATVCSDDNDSLTFRHGDTSLNINVAVKAYEPRGLIVLIADNDGLEKLSFHVRVNGASYAKDITTRSDGYYVFEDKYAKLKVGDTLEYWVFIQYKGVGQRFDRIHTVMELIPAEIYPRFDNEPSNDIPNSSNQCQKKTQNKSTPECNCNGKLLQETLSKFRALEQIVYSLQEQVNILTETNEELVNIMDIGAILLVTGDLPAKTNPVEDVRHLLIEKLKLETLSNNIIQAEYVENGIKFEMASPVDKLRILKSSRKNLINQKFQVIKPGEDMETHGESIITPRFGSE